MSASQDLDTGTIKEYLRVSPLFNGLSEENLDLLYEMSSVISLPAGEVLIEEGAAADALYVLLEGEIEVWKRQGSKDIFLARRGVGQFLGEQALLDGGRRQATLKTLQDSRFLEIRQIAFDTLLTCSPTIPKAIIRTMQERQKSTEALLLQQQKMVALGTMSAGLAHELNNPAAAIKRSSAQLAEMLPDWERWTAEVNRLDLDPRQQAALQELRQQTLHHAANPTIGDPLACSVQEDMLESWLDEHDVDRAWELAPVLVSFGWDAPALKGLSETFTAEQLPVIVRWIAAGSTAFGLLREVEISADQMSNIVKAMKTYSYLDQAPVQEVDIHQSLENTLVMLKHKTKHGVSIVREFSGDVPRIEAYGSELNQVWTNLIDNAVDAMDQRGEIVLRTYLDGSEVVVEIQDNGPGIPPENQSRIFDQFYTTKGPGLGTGMGLHVVENIVSKHGGQIHLKSDSSGTCFQVRLPVQLPRG